MKIQKRSESNVLSELHSTESRGYVNDGTQQLHEITPGSLQCVGNRPGVISLPAADANASGSPEAFPFILVFHKTVKNRFMRPLQSGQRHRR